MKTIRLSHENRFVFRSPLLGSFHLPHVGIGQYRLRSQPAPSSLRHETRNNARAISTILSRGSREIESRKKFRGRPPKERVKNVHAHVEHPSLCIQARSENERFRYILLRTYIFFLFSFSTTVERWWSHPFYTRWARKGSILHSRVVHTRTPDIVGEIENNNNGDGEKKSDKKRGTF